MSHFTVLVVGENIERQLAPFHEFECTGVDDEFVQDLDETEEVKNAFAARSGDAKDQTELAFAQDYFGYETVPFGQTPDLAELHKYGYIQVAEDGTVAKVVRRTNPNRKWDWYQVGGRWSGMFLLKDGAKERRADQAKKGDIDFDSMRNQAGEAAAMEHDEFYAALDGNPIPPKFSDLIEKHGRENIDAAREEYKQLPAVIALYAARKMPLFKDVHEVYGCTRDEFIQRARDNAISTFAVLKDAQWYERGSMGWWGMVADEQDRDAWNKQFGDLLDGLPDDTLLTAVDCHI